MPFQVHRPEGSFLKLEALLVLAILGVLVATLLPEYQKYAQRGRFMAAVSQLAELQPYVQACLARHQTLEPCSSGFDGIPEVAANPENGIASISIESGVMTLVAEERIFGRFAGEPIRYVLTPIIHDEPWSVQWELSGNCLAAGLCS
jgi:Tfp pilus assembly major pilin PilA